MSSGSNNSYVDKLREVFISCDTSGCELLGKDELHELCDKLQLDEDQAYYIIDHLLIDQFTKVDFNEFKEVFVTLLTRSHVGYDEIPNLSNPCSPIKHKSSSLTTLSSSSLSSPSSPSSVSTSSPASLSTPSSQQPSSCSNGDDINNQVNNLGKPISADHTHSHHSNHSHLHQHHHHHQYNNVVNHHSSLSDVDYGNSCVTSYSNTPHNSTTTGAPNNNNNNNSTQCTTNINNNNNQLNNNNNNTSTSSAINPTSTEQLLRSIWDKLRVGQDGYLNIDELYAVCEHVGMEMNEDVIEQLFEKLDCDRDGKVSFDELLQGLFEHNRSSVVNSNQQVNGIFKKSDCQKIDLTGGDSHFTSIPPTKDYSRKCSLTTDGFIKCQPGEPNSRQPSDDDSFGTTGNYFQSLDPLNVGYADFDSVISLWDSFGFTNARLLLKDLGFDSKTGRISIRDLSHALEEELFAAFTNSSDLFQIALTMFQHELNYTQILYEQTRDERDQLRINLSEANARANLLAQEVDDHHAKLEKSSKEKLILLERRYQDQIRCLQEEFQRERDSLASQSMQLRKELTTVQMMSQNNQSKLEDLISSLKLDNLRLEKEVQELSDRLADAIKVNIDLQKEVEETYSIKKKLSEIELFQVFDKEAEYQGLINDNDLLRRQNKELRDENDGLILEMERMNQKLERRAKKGSKYDTASSMKRMRSHHNKNWANEI